MLAELVQNFVIVLMLTCQSRSSDPLDIILYTATPLVGNDSNSWFRGYALQDDKDIRHLSVGVLYKNIDGKDNVTWDDITGEVRNYNSYMEMPDDKIFHTSSRIAYRVHGDFAYLGVLTLPTQTDRVGVFSFEAKKGGIVTNSAIVLTSASAIIEFEYRTITVSIGESVRINIRNGSFIDNIRWRHNYEELYNLRNASSVVIENIHIKDDGVFECYIGDNPDGNHGIMRLIVRACPSPKWSLPDCEMDCPVCYNNGVCDDKTGVCICPAGFDGDACKHDCGNNNWGRDCLNVCSSKPGSTCRGALVCPPDPVGCTCVNGFEGNDCDTGFYYIRFSSALLDTLEQTVAKNATVMIAIVIYT
ncbi:tyrosine-protein kinase receptor Tie-1-like [Antedon mediterranea]|uniref:tyrosine-protein kinase receptor Tie-1-like n=1 Tax=Antedon mediterranea TaxID=105859 RepID=UPI003AF4FC19